MAPVQRASEWLIGLQTEPSSLYLKPDQRSKISMESRIESRCSASGVVSSLSQSLTPPAPSRFDVQASETCFSNSSTTSPAETPSATAS